MPMAHWRLNDYVPDECLRVHLTAVTELVWVIRRYCVVSRRVSNFGPLNSLQIENKMGEIEKLKCL